MNDNQIEELKKQIKHFGDISDYHNRITELLESNNRHLQEARDAKEETNKLRQFINQMIANFKPDTYEHIEKGGEYRAIAAKINTSVRDDDNKPVNVWDEGFVYISLWDGSVYARTEANFKQTMRKKEPF